MFIIHGIIALLIWVASGHAIEKIYQKAGFIHTPKFVFWLPALNMMLLIYLAIYQWPVLQNNKTKIDEE
ncbi:hypothetical protein CBF23_007425 [Marinomonas agarivorans]|nr:hypothetical protein CBF23_007425 [Marinomonas agarivorans]